MPFALNVTSMRPARVSGEIDRGFHGVVWRSWKREEWRVRSEECSVNRAKGERRDEDRLDLPFGSETLD